MSHHLHNSFLSSLCLFPHCQEGDTALHDAVHLNRYKIVKLLIVAGADTTIQNHVSFSTWFIGDFKVGKCVLVSQRVRLDWLEDWDQ